ncbi:MAG TPA: ABC transporter ATP-binding protein [Solirubrobacteraceae bacterium]
MASCYGPYRSRLAFLLITSALASARMMAGTFILRAIIDEGIVKHDETTLTVLVIAMILLALVSEIFNVWQVYASNAIGQAIMHDLRTAVFRRLQSMPLAFFTYVPNGQLQSRIANDIDGLGNVLTSAATTSITYASTVIVAVVTLFLLDWRLALVSLCCIPPLVWMMHRVGGMRGRFVVMLQQRLGDMLVVVSESLSVSGIILSRTMDGGGAMSASFEAQSRGIADLQLRSRMAGRWALAVSQLTFAIQLPLVYWLAGQGVFGGSLTIGTVVAFGLLQLRLLVPIQILLGTGADMKASLALFDRVFTYLDLMPEIVEAPKAVSLDRTRLSGAVRFDHVSFRYARAADAGWTVEDIDLVVPAGTTTAIVGPSGAGKTTLGYLITRLYEPQKGRVTIDGVDISQVTLDSLAEVVAVVSQETYLFHATLRENLLFARPDARERELENAVRSARLADVIASLPAGLETVVGDRGFRFSGGERQRVAIARTLLRNPAVLVLDEATSALDTETEAAVHDELSRLADGRTTFVIAHRLSTIRDADQVVVLEKGHIAEVGTYDELMQHKYRHQALANTAGTRDARAGKRPDRRLRPADGLPKPWAG